MKHLAWITFNELNISKYLAWITVSEFVQKSLNSLKLVYLIINMLQAVINRDQDSKNRDPINRVPKLGSPK